MQRDSEVVLVPYCNEPDHTKNEAHFHMKFLKFCKHGTWIRLACHNCDFGV